MSIPEVEVAITGEGLLAEFNEAGVLELADVNSARRLAQLCAEPDERVWLAMALAVRAVRQGSVCLDLSRVSTSIADTDDDTSELRWPESQAWRSAVARSTMTHTMLSDTSSTHPMLAPNGDADTTSGAVDPAHDPRPLRLLGPLVYLDRYWRQEESVRLSLTRRRTAPPPADVAALASGLDAIFDRDGLAEHEVNWQRVAGAVSVLSPVTVLAGGPGTGKTTTVAKILALLQAQPGPAPRIALAAPTGKAAARLEVAVRTAAAELDGSHAFDADALKAVTIHRLLGWLPQSGSRFRHNRSNPLAYDVVVVDETSMVSLTMMDRLLEALPVSTRLILVGDPDQLTSVEAGAVLADVTRADQLAVPIVGDDPRLLALRRARADDRPASGPGSSARGSDLDAAARGVVELTHTWRFGGAIAELAEAIRRGDADAAVEIIASGSSDLSLVDTPAEETALSDLPTLAKRCLDAALAVDVAARGAGGGREGDPVAALEAVDEHRVLCAHRRGPAGVARWAYEIEEYLAAAVPGYGAEGEWYVGRPLMITQNDPGIGLYNGDTGVVVDARTGPRAAFARGGTPALFAPIQLDAVQTVHAMTVHKAQGSQFRRVTLVLPSHESALLTRELLYTAVTRATRHVSIIGSLAAIHRAVGRPANRASGLRGRL